MIRPLVLIILDGWGIAPAGPGNAISQAQTPFWSKLLSTYPHTNLQAAGEAVGLPKHEVGNTETGHLNLGAGRIIYQDLPRINQAIADGSFFTNSAFLQAIAHAQQHNSNLHLMGLVGTGGVHASTDHLFALLRLAKNQNFTRVYLHLFTDGRDSPPTSALSFIDRVIKTIAELGIGTIATIIGRYFAMDRDSRLDRTQAAYASLTGHSTTTAPSAITAINQAYTHNYTDEFIPPTIILNPQGQPLPRIASNDAVIFYNFRIDRALQLTQAFVVTPKLSHLFFVTMTEYAKNLPVTVAFPPETVDQPLGQVLSLHHLKQLLLAETEKQRFITYYFNGQREDPFPGEDRVIIPSAKVATYDLKPAMSAPELTQTLIDRAAANTYDFIAVNFANPDMVAHSGNITATIAACTTIDQCLSQIVPPILNQNGLVLITADHGNAEEMIHPDTGTVETEHSDNQVPFVLVGKNYTSKLELPPGILADVAPTILKLMDLPIPEVMTGKPLL